MANWWEGLTVDNPSVGNPQQALQSLNNLNVGYTTNTPLVLNSSGSFAGGSVLGASQQIGPNVYPNSFKVTSTGGPQTSGGGGGDSKLTQYSKMAASGGLNPSQQSEYDALLAAAQNTAGAAEGRIRSGIEDAYKSYESRLDEISNWLPTQQVEQEKIIGDTYGNLVSGIDTSKKLAQDKLNTIKTGVINTGKESASKIAENLRNMLRASNMQIGAMGAGDTSASNVMMPYAYSKLASKEMGANQRNTNNNLLSIEQKGIDLESTYNDQKTGIEQWKATNLSNIKNTFLPMLTSLRTAKANAPVEKMSALNQLEASIMSNAMNKVNAIETEARNYARTLDTWARDRLAQLDNMKLSLGNSANFDPMQYVANELPGISGVAQGVQDNFNYANPGLKRKNTTNGISY